MMFAITDRKGFHMTFANGWTVSVQFGRGNYCANRDNGEYGKDAETSPNAEIAAWNGDEWHKFDGDVVRGWVSANGVAAFISEVAAK